jgi:hypothetical protein
MITPSEAGNCRPIPPAGYPQLCLGRARSASHLRCNASALAAERSDLGVLGLDHCRRAALPTYPVTRRQDQSYLPLANLREKGSMRRIIVGTLAAVAAVLGVLAQVASGGVRWAAVVALALTSALAAALATSQEPRGSGNNSSRDPGRTQSAPQETKPPRRNSRRSARGTRPDPRATPVAEYPAKSKPRRQRAEYPVISKPGRHIVAFVSPFVISILWLPVLLLILRNARDRAFRANSVLSLELAISWWLAVILRIRANNYYNTIPWVFRWIGALSNVLIIMASLLVLYCIIMVARHRQPIIAGYTKIAFWVADRAARHT